MEKYEEKLHFDKHYEKLQSSSGAGVIYRLIYGVLIYTAIYYVFKYAQSNISDICPWNNFQSLFNLYNVNFSIADCIYFAIGLICYCYGSVRLTKITAENHSAKDEKNENPVKLLTSGVYSDLRHPMYGSFIIMQTSIFLSLRSLIGLIIAIVIIAFQYFNALQEEKKKLIPQFKDEYIEYSKTTKRMLLKIWQVIILTCVFVFTVIGFLFK